MTTGRPLSITMMSWLFIAAGTVGIIYHAPEFKEFSLELIGTLVVRAVAIIGGLFALRGANWARWLLLIWITYHVGLSIFHTKSEIAVHLVLLIVVGYVFFLSKGSAYFQKK